MISRDNIPVAIESPWGDVRITVLLLILPVPGDMAIFGLQTLRRSRYIDVMSQVNVRMQGGDLKDREKGIVELEPPEVTSKTRICIRLAVGKGLPA